MRRIAFKRRTTKALLAAATAAIVVFAAMTPAFAGDTPSGFWWGTDGSGPAPSSSASSCASSAVPWLEPNVSNAGCGQYGSYRGQLGGAWQLRSGCTGMVAWNGNAGNAARANYSNSGGATMGATGYFTGGGPGLDPNYDGTTTEAYAWGKQQAQKAVADIAGYQRVLSRNFIVLVVLDGGADGWNEHVTGCTTSTGGTISTSLDRQTFNGFWDYIQNNTSYSVGVYSSPSMWTSIFGTGTDASLTGTMEITADWGGNCANPAPTSWTQPAGACASNSADFFGGITSSSNCALGWEWAAGTNNYEQMDVNRYGLCA